MTRFLLEAGCLRASPPAGRGTSRRLRYARCCKSMNGNRMLQSSVSYATDTCASEFGFSCPSNQTDLPRTCLKNCSRFNTLFYILQKQRPDLTLRVCHRLDRLTSGLTILAKTAERAGVIQTQIGGHSLVPHWVPCAFCV